MSYEIRSLKRPKRRDDSLLDFNLFGVLLLRLMSRSASSQVSAEMAGKTNCGLGSLVLCLASEALALEFSPVRDRLVVNTLVLPQLAKSEARR